MLPSSRVRISTAVFQAWSNASAVIASLLEKWR
jgi:hypothetical protein